MLLQLLEYHFFNIFAIDFIYQCCATMLDLFIAMIFVGNSMDKIAELLAGFTWPSIFCFTTASIVGGLITPSIIRLIKKINIKIADFLFAGLALLDINALVTNSPDNLRIVFPGFVAFLLIYLFFQDGKSKQMQSQFQYYSQMEKYERKKNDELSKLRHDIVNHCINDISVQGAEPVYFMDYIGIGKLRSPLYEQVLSGIAKACREANCAVLGGETAEMPGMYGNDFDLVGVITGIGFTSNQDFTNYTIKRTQGIFPVKEEQPTSADSTAIAEDTGGAPLHHPSNI